MEISDYFELSIFQDSGFSKLDKMPCAGAVVPPIIIPLRKQVPGKPSTHIDTCTYLELETGMWSVFFSLVGGTCTLSKIQRHNQAQSVGGRTQRTNGSNLMKHDGGEDETHN